MPEVSEVEAVLTNVPENEQVRLALAYIGKYLELIHKDLQELEKVLAEIQTQMTQGVTVWHGRI